MHTHTYVCMYTYPSPSYQSSIDLANHMTLLARSRCWILPTSQIFMIFFSFSILRPFDTDGEQQTPGERSIWQCRFYLLRESQCKLVFLRGVTEPEYSKHRAEMFDSFFSKISHSHIVEFWWNFLYSTHPLGHYITNCIQEEIHIFRTRFGALEQECKYSLEPKQHKQHITKKKHEFPKKNLNIMDRLGEAGDVLSQRCLLVRDLRITWKRLGRR
jgi:hypothetical protein